jgi:hypothetical protein
MVASCGMRLMLSLLFALRALGGSLLAPGGCLGMRLSSPGSLDALGDEGRRGVAEVLSF